MAKPKRHRPRKRRNAYRDVLFVRQTMRQWLHRIGHADLDKMYAVTLKESDPMPLPDIAISITIRGRERRLTFPPVQAGNINAAAARLDWWRQTAAADQTVLDAAEAVLAAIEKATR